MSLNILPAFNALQQHAMTSGFFERVNGSEPKSAPGISGLTYAVWLQALRPTARASGLAVTSALAVFSGRVYTSMISETPDAIDPNMATATAALMEAYSGDFQLGGEVAAVDLLGIHGAGLAAEAGYLNMDGRLMRVMTLTIPVIYNDVWGQVA